MSGTNQSKVRVVLRNPLNFSDQVEYTIRPNDTKLAADWIAALKQLLLSKNILEKNYCFIGFPKSQRTIHYLCQSINSAVKTINNFDFSMHGLPEYIIEDWFCEESVRFDDSYPIKDTVLADSISKHKTLIGLHPKHSILNRLHNYFEQLQGTVSAPSQYYVVADYETKYAIRQLNILCHELENLILSQRKERVAPDWIRPSQITTFLTAPRYPLDNIHREGFVENGYDRRFGHVYMHWAQIGKTLFEVWRDEGAPKLTNTVCEAITHLEYYSGEFDIDWGRSVTREDRYPWHEKSMIDFTEWLVQNNLDPNDKNLSLGYLPLGEIELISNFGTTDRNIIWQILSTHLDIYKIEVDGVSNTFDYCWTDQNYKQMQIDIMKPGYDFSSKY